MSFAQELQDFAAGFKATYHNPTEADRQRAKDAIGESVGDAAAAAGPRAIPNLGTSWAAGDTPGSVTTPGAVPLDDTAKYNPEGSVPTFARSAGTQASMDELDAAKRAIAGNESGGRYNALGPVTGGDRAYGKYQIMGKNIPEWTRAALGRAMTPQEFLNNPDAQEKTFEHRFGGYMAKYGPEGAAATWFSGSPNWRGSNRRDVLGTSVPRYVGNFSSQFNRFRGVKAYAAGGAVDDEPTPAAVGNAEGYALLNQGTTSPQWLTDPHGMGDIADAAVDYATKTFKLDQSAIQGASPQSQAGARAYAMGVGAATPEQVKQVEQVVDPSYRMSRPERQIAKYKAMYDYWMDHNEPERAQRAVFAMAMAAKDAARTYGVVAMQALQRGDTKIAADAIARAYDEIPDGREVKVNSVDKDGVNFEMYDINNNVTDKGKFAINEMVRAATGMMDGTQFFQQWGQIRSRTDKAGARREQELQAVQAFEEGLGDARKGYIATLSPENRARFFRTPRQYQHDKAREWERTVEAQRKQGNFELRREDMLDKRTSDEEFRNLKLALGEGRFEARRNDQNNRFEIRRSDAASKWIAIGDEKVAAALERKALAEGKMAGRTPKLTADERKQAAVDTTADTALRAARSRVPEMTGFDQPERQAVFAETEGTQAAARTYSAQEAARKGQPAVGDMGKIRELIDTNLKTSTNPQLSPQKRNALVTVANTIARANTDVDEQTAADIAMAAGAKSSSIKFVSDPTDPSRTRVQVNDHQPVVLDGNSIGLLAMIRGGVLRGATSDVPNPFTPNPEVQRMTSGPTAEPARPGSSPTPSGGAVPVGGVSGMNPVQDAQLRARKMRADLDNAKTRARREQARRALDLGERSIPVHGLYP